MSLVGYIKSKIASYLIPDKSPEEMAEERMYPSGTDVGLRHTSLDSGIHVRDDGVVEINSGSTSITLDGKSGIICIGGKKIALSSSDILHLASGGQVFGNGVLNSKWLPPSWLPEIPFSNKLPALDPTAFKRCALSPMTPATMATSIMISVPGVPAGVAVPISTLFEAKPIFNQRKMTKTIERALLDILKEIE